MRPSANTPIRARKGRRASSRRNLQAMSEINVTPFVDVVLVLLIVFMVVAPLLTVGIPLELPKTAAKALAHEREEPLVLSITKDGQLLLQEKSIEDDALIGQLRALNDERQSRKIFIRADGAIAYARIAQIMGAVNAAGFLQIGLITDGDGPRFDGTDK